MLKISNKIIEKVKQELDDQAKVKPTQPEFLKNDPLFKKIIKEKFDLDISNFLGMGQYNVAYEKNNLIFKFTKNKNDILKTIAISSLRYELPEEFHKHILYVEDFGSFKLKGVEIYYIIAEKLFELSMVEKSLLLKNEAYADLGFFTTTILTEENFNKIIEIINANVSVNLTEIIDGVRKAELMSIITKKLDENNFGKTDFGRLSKEEYIQKMVDNSRTFSGIIVTSFIKYVKDKFKERLLINNIQKVVDDIGKIYLIDKRFPKNYKQKQIIKGFGKELFEFLNILKEKGIYFSDTHTSNIMKRKNGDLVLSDVGLFVFV